MESVESLVPVPHIQLFDVPVDGTEPWKLSHPEDKDAVIRLLVV